jgi:hypothetical protein
MIDSTIDSLIYTNVDKDDANANNLKKSMFNYFGFKQFDFANIEDGLKRIEPVFDINKNKEVFEAEIQILMDEQQKEIDM